MGLLSAKVGRVYRFQAILRERLEPTPEKIGLLGQWDCGEHVTPLGLVSGFQKHVRVAKDLQSAGEPSSWRRKNGELN